MANDKWQMANGKWQITNGKWKMAMAMAMKRALPVVSPDEDTVPEMK